MKETEISSKKTAFVAYSSADPKVARIVRDAVMQANAKPLPTEFEPWVFNDVSGTPLISPIVEKIDDSAFVIADITYLNLNVVYEVGFAIGKGKRVFLIRHKPTIGDKELANEVGIFDTLGYYEYETITDLQRRFSAYIDDTPLVHSFPMNRKALVFILEPLTSNRAIKVLISRVKKAGYYHYRSFNPDEDLRLSATDAIRQVSESSAVVMPLQELTVNGAEAHNIRAMFVSGLADGMEKPRLTITPHNFKVPLDIRDTIKPFKREEDIFEAVAEFCPKIVEYTSRADPEKEELLTKLESLDVGDPRAENEMSTLGQYYLKTHEYERASKGEVNLVVGRKGSGKTALWVRLRDKTRIDKRNIVLDLKPEGYQLIKLKEDILEHLTKGAREHLITAFWEYLLLLEVAYKLLEKDQHTYRNNHNLRELYIELERSYRAPEFSTEGDFAERLSSLSQRIINEYKSKFDSEDGQKLSTAQVTELLYAHDLKELRRNVSEYLVHKKSVWVLIDNLDRGWSTKGFDELDAIVLRCLVDAGRHLEREMKKEDHDFHCIIFVRNDVYDHLMKYSTDYGKEMRATLDWSDSDLLKEMLRLRLVSSLDESKDTTFEAFWRQICVAHFDGEETSSYMIERSLMRPRNLLKIFGHCRGFATNFHHKRIENTDIEKGLKAYSEDLLQELDRELGDVHPEARDLLYYFIDCSSILDRNTLESIILESGVKKTQITEVIDFLLYYGIIGIQSKETEYYIYSVNYDLKVLHIRASRDSASKYVINPAFWPALNIVRPRSAKIDH